MKITFIEVEASANDLQSSNTIAGSMSNLLRRVLAPVTTYEEVKLEEEDNNE